MKCRELIDYCLTFPSAFEDYPFGETLAVMKHSSNSKMFALIDKRNDVVYINLKCEPMLADFLRSVIKSVVPGWHMNKVNWNTVTMGAGPSCASDVSAENLYDMIQHSFDLTKPKVRKRK